MKRYIRSSTGYNISWYTQDGRQCGEYVEVPSNTDAYDYIERYLQDKYGDEFGGVADYISEYEGVDASSITAMTEEEMLDDAILNGRPFDLNTFNKYKVDPYRAKGAVKAADLEVGDIIQVTEDASEINCPSPEIEIMDIRYDDPDEFGHDCITFYCYDNETGDEYTLHFWPEEYVGPIIAKKSAYSVQSATDATEASMKWSDMWRPYSGSPSAFTTLYVDGQEVGYVEAWESDGAYGYIAYLKADPTEYEESVGEFRSLDAAKACLESIVQDTQDQVDSFPVTSSEIINRYSDVRPYEDRKYWYFTLHGLGPGTIPSDLNVLDTQEGVNDKGTRGLFICLDGVLNTDELEYYDLKELAPQDISSASDVEDEDSWSPYGNHNYLIQAGPYVNVSFKCDDPKSAITHWYQYQVKYPMDVQIMCPTRALALDLINAATPKLLTSLDDKFGCPYKLDYMIDEVAKAKEKGCSSFHEGSYGYGDSVHPFSVG